MALCFNTHVLITLASTGFCLNICVNNVSKHGVLFKYTCVNNVSKHGVLL